MSLLVEIVVCERGLVNLNANFRGNGGLPTNDCWRQNTRVPGLARGIVCAILRLAVFVLCRFVTDGQTDGRTHDDG